LGDCDEGQRDEEETEERERVEDRGKRKEDAPRGLARVVHGPYCGVGVRDGGYGGVVFPRVANLSSEVGEGQRAGAYA
jgi:hypothetical protein